MFGSSHLEDKIAGFGLSSLFSISLEPLGYFEKAFDCGHPSFASWDVVANLIRGPEQYEHDHYPEEPARELGVAVSDWHLFDDLDRVRNGVVDID